MKDEGDQRLAEQALRQLRSTVVPVEDTERVEQRRPRLVAALEREIRAVPLVRARRLRRSRTAWGMLAAAAVVVFAWGTVRLTNDTSFTLETTVPVTVDHLVPLADAREFRRLIPNSRLAVLRGAAHNPMVDRPDAFNRILLRFLAGEDIGR